MGEQTTQGSRDGRLVLAVDTSTAALAAALVRGGEVLREVQSLAERNHSVHTVSAVQTMLEACGVKPEALDGLAIGRGPGSYTGMRIAVSLGKTLAWAWDKPLVGVSSLEALAYGAWPAASAGADGAPAGRAWIVPVMDARRGQAYTARFAAIGAAPEAANPPADGAWTREAPDAIRLMRDWTDELAAALGAADDASRPDAVWLVGELAQHEAEAGRLQALCPAVRVHALPLWLEGRAVAALGAKRLAAGERDDVHAFAPNYTQLTEAEVKLQEKQAAAEGAVGHDAN
ncbi:tRNA threonylcarbamoyladenosine biosynthesis protein TsaB [Paenibacillus sp. UNC496MF]|uniref:tRNA (adenosine(37)-N6)-threonylcarbamoyltransferase complex dimerization subunit type 1 TsaB n=1 Tax=Paenibacillus sp. UNC496MF TaxID=1502753 RepID=UPI0008F2DA80|nr:tRNA (adenosine(37)-N6)-threonylcarbamoyltransferase complex dimerization subunit type 1 TsaB [Paenibacillus sp. UNC496MF]SFJ43484.1 tRNA threonylcarbamoyladenosine biosynthesis protein TsaB [Paenibacillus sp. UNC496MF]